MRNRLRARTLINGGGGMRRVGRMGDEGEEADRLWGGDG
jgi:hypothetical protein